MRLWAGNRFRPVSPPPRFGCAWSPLAAVVEQLPHQGFALDDLEGRLWYEGKGRAGARLATDFRIPGPAELAALGGLTVPDSVWTLVGGSSPCTGNLRFDAGFSPDFLALDRAAAQLDLQPASWLQQGHLQAAVQAGRVTVDSLNMALPMASLQGSGWIDSTRVEWTGGFALQDSILLGQLAGPDFQGALVRARGRVNVAGPWRDPRGEITLESSLAGPAYQVPEFSLRGPSGPGANPGERPPGGAGRAGPHPGGFLPPGRDRAGLLA